MTTSMQEPEVLQRILADNLSLEEEKSAVETLLQKNPKAGLALLPVYVEQKHRYKAAEHAIMKEFAEYIEQVHQPPWHPAMFLRLLTEESRRGIVVSGNRQIAVALDPQLDLTQLSWGCRVYLSNDLSLLVNLAPELSNSGAVGTFSRFHDGRAILKGYGDEEVVVQIGAEMRENGLKEGSLLLYDRDSLVAWEEVVGPGEQTYLLEDIPDVTFADIGGLDEVIEEVLDEINLHFFHTELVRQHQLNPAKGVLLCGPPGVGKTMIAKALANHLSQMQDVQARFLRVPPGIHRSKLYGGTEEKIRELFAQARRLADGENRFCVMFFDDVDQLGARGDSISTAIDTRVLPCFLDELDGLNELHRVLVIGATNRPDLMDEALLRSGRFGDRAFRIPRPGREAARQIFRKHLTANLPYYENGRRTESMGEEIIEKALAAMYAPNGELHQLATLTFRDGSRKPLTTPQVMSGALISNTVSHAKRRSCQRAIRRAPVGIKLTDMLAALYSELLAITERLRPGEALRQMLDLPQDMDVVKVELDPGLKEPKSFEYMAHG
jgi:proteasome-associated ATPase